MTPRVPLVLIPGLNCSARIFGGFVADLWTRGPVMIADHTEGVTIAAIAHHILDNSPSRFALCGYSMGGYVALAITREAPERVVRLAFCSTHRHEPIPPSNPSTVAG